MRMYFAILALAMALFPAVASAQSERTIIVNFTTHTLEVHQNGQTLMSTAVVLPKRQYYPIPVSGTLTTAVMGPTWNPTPRMLATGKYRRHYGPYSAGNAMGHCKLSIQFDLSHRILQYVRIHGNAQPEDLGRNLSAGCVRVPDSFCQQLVDAANGAQNVRIHFVQ